MTKVKNWGVAFGNFMNGYPLPDPYSIDENGLNAFDAVTRISQDMAKYADSNNLNQDEYFAQTIMIRALKREFLKNEIQRVLHPEFKPRFTEKLANEINQKESELLR